jgi:ferredoxin-NADP reductase
MVKQGSARGMFESKRLTILSTRREAEDVKSFLLHDPAGEPLPRWTPGAHIDVTTPAGLTSQYSLCGGEPRRTWRIATLLKRDGKGVSRYLHDEAHAGASIKVSAPRNHFELVGAPSYLFIAGGIGITPILPMIAKVATQGTPWRLVYGGRKRTSMAFLEELERFKGNIAILPESECGLLPLPELIRGSDPNGAIYCCGPEPLISAVEAIVRDCRLAAPHVERFTPIESTLHSGDTGFDVELARTGRIIKVGPRQTILDALEENGVCLAASCREGVCGTCETTVLAGDIDHRDSVLSAAERQSGRSMMICVSRARSAKLKLDV